MEEIHNENKFIKEEVEYSKTDIEDALMFLSTNTTRKYKSDNTGEEYSILYKNNRYAIKRVYEQMRIAKGLDYENRIKSTSIKDSFSKYYEILPRIGSNDRPGSKKNILENLKKEFKAYLNSLYPEGYDKTYEYDPFYLINDRATDIKDFCKENNICFWKIFENDDNLEKYYQVLKEKRSANTYNSYMSSTNRLKDFFNQKYGGYINWLRTLSDIDIPKINFELIEDWALNYLGKYHSAGNSDSGTKGPKVIGEFKKLGSAVVSQFPDYTLSSCTSWQNSGKIYQYLWIQFKHKDKQDSPCSISMFVIKENDKAKLCIETEIDGKNAKSKDYESFLKTLNTTFVYDSSWYLEDENSTVFDNIEKALNSIDNGKSKKVKTVKQINGPYLNKESNRIINELQLSFEKLIPSYMNIFEPKLQPKGNDMNLNQILYGPPGTGKTYNTVVKAMEILEPDLFKDKNNKPTYELLKRKFDDYKEKHQIEFVTFHQSYSYEEFVEGIKPYIPEWGSTDNSEVRYIGENGIFKNICNNANNEFEKIFNKFKEKYPEGSNLETLYNLKYNEQSIIYDCGENAVKDNKNRKISIEKLKWVYDKNREYSNADDFYHDYKNEAESLKYYPYKVYCELLKIKKEPYILIIDEINRGDVSKIFGELITLIEEDKRVGNKHQMKITLPYSKKTFGVPNNLHIIGTMNTADRSIALLDTALRRRFDFEEIMPKPEILNNKDVEGINLQTLLKKINIRITEKYDRDHQIGHSYLMDVDSKEQLQRAYKNRILPLLNEYFYNDSKTVSEILNCSEEELKTADFIYILNKAQNDNN